MVHPGRNRLPAHVHRNDLRVVPDLLVIESQLVAVVESEANHFAALREQKGAKLAAGDSGHLSGFARHAPQRHLFRVQHFSRSAPPAFCTKLGSHLNLAISTRNSWPTDRSKVVINLKLILIKLIFLNTFILI